MTTGVWVLLIAVVASLGFGGFRLLTDGRFRGTRALPPTAVDPRAPDPELAEPAVAEPVAEPAPLQTPWTHVSAAVGGAELGERATLVQFSSAFCAPCRATRRTLTDIVAVVPGVAHLEVDAEHHLELVRRLDVLRTPTTLVLDASGREVARATGAPRKEQVLAALATVTR